MRLLLRAQNAPQFLWITPAGDPWNQWHDVDWYGLFLSLHKIRAIQYFAVLWVGHETHVRFEAVSASEETKVLPVKYVSMILSACSIQPAGNFSLQRNLHEPR